MGLSIPPKVGDRALRTTKSSKDTHTYANIFTHYKEPATMSPAEKLLSTYYNSQDTGVSNFKTAAGSPWWKSLLRFFFTRPGPANLQNRQWVWSPQRTTAVGGIGLVGAHALHSRKKSPDIAEFAPLDLGEAKSEDDKDVPGTAAYAATGGVGAGLVSILYGKLADKPDLQRDLLSALAGTAAGAIVGSSKNKETA